MLACALFALACGVRIASDPQTRRLDLALVALLAAIAAQTVPLPPFLIRWLSPSLPRYFANTTLLQDDALPGRASAHALSIDPAATLYCLALMSAVLLVFWACRRMLAEGGSRRLVRAITTIGFLVAVASLIFRATAPNLILGFWPTADVNAEPMGPFVNRNHYATWMIMAFPLAMGYLAMRFDARPVKADRRPWVTRMADAMEARNLWLVASALAMLVSILASTSRSGMMSVAAGLVVGAIAARRLVRGASRAWLMAGGVGVAVVLASFADINAILVRWDETFSTPNLGRLVVWRDTIGVIRDFWLTGTGAGTYQKAMLVYQVALRGVNYFNHAHNHYLQVASEGGLLLSVPTVASLAFLVGLVRQRLREDLSPTRWLRIGAATGLFSVGLQSVWETGLRLPANAILCAALWAIAVHQSPQQTAPSGSQKQRRY